MEAKPLQIVPSSHNTAGGPQKKIDMGHTIESQGRKRIVMVKEEKEKEKNSSSFSSSVELHLGVAATHSAPQAINHVMITEAQRCELHHQVLIFNNLLYNLPLLQSHHFLHFPTNMSEYSHPGFEYGSMVDPEPHRCRRTDGKKWRCSKSVVPDQKYCERHMHRGRNRSRKPVETSQVSSTLVTKPSKSHIKPASKTEVEISNSSVLAVQPGNTSSSTPARTLSVVNCASANNSRLKNSSSSGDYLASVSSASLVSPGSTLATPVAPKVVTFSSIVNANSDNRSCLNVCKKDSHIKSCVSNNISVKSGGKGSIAGGDGSGISTGIGFSPRSVLQVSGCNPSYLNDRNNIEPEPGRCRRTDGKKWRCKNAILPGQKYCSTHMHRGAKKRFTNHEPPATTTMPPCSAITVARLPQSSAATNLQKAYCTIPNTNLSMSVPATEPFIQCNEKSVSSSDTDTTITDTLNECSYASF